MSRLFRRKLQRLAEGGGPACLSVLLDGWPTKQAAKLGEISLSQIMPCVTAPDEEEEEEAEAEEDGEEGEGLRRGGAPRRPGRHNGRPWVAGGKHSKAFKQGRNEKEFWAPGGRQSGVHKRKAGRAYAIQFSDGADRIAAKPKRGRPNHRSSRSR